MRRVAGARSNYLVLPLFAFANAGVVIEPGVVAGHEPLMLAITLALVLGKPAGMFGFSALAVRLGLATKPDAYSWPRSEEHTSELQSLMRISYAVFCLKKKKKTCYKNRTTTKAR